MGASQRRKGAVGERELIGLLRDRLGDLPSLRRNLDQSRTGGTDFRVGGHAIEVKRAERFLSAWMEQAERLAGDDLPVVAWRRNGGRWRFLLVLDIDGFAEMVRDSQGTPGSPKAAPVGKERISIHPTASVGGKRAVGNPGMQDEGAAKKLTDEPPQLDQQEM